MARMRTIEQAATYMKQQDENTALTKTALRRLVVTGNLPSVTVGTKYLISLEVLEDYLISGVTSKTELGGIRRIGACL